MWAKTVNKLHIWTLDNRWIQQQVNDIEMKSIWNGSRILHTAQATTEKYLLSFHFRLFLCFEILYGNEASFSVCSHGDLMHVFVSFSSSIPNECLGINKFYSHLHGKAGQSNDWTRDWTFVIRRSATEFGKLLVFNVSDVYTVHTWTNPYLQFYQIEIK